MHLNERRKLARKAKVIRHGFNFLISVREASLILRQRQHSLVRDHVAGIRLFELAD